jgi:hypothetical protein
MSERSPGEPTSEGSNAWPLTDGMRPDEVARARSRLRRVPHQFGPAHVRGAKPLIRRVIEVSGLDGVLQVDGPVP